MKNLSYKKFTLALFTLAAVFSFGFVDVMGSEADVAKVVEEIEPGGRNPLSKAGSEMVPKEPMPSDNELTETQKKSINDQQTGVRNQIAAHNTISFDPAKMPDIAPHTDDISAGAGSKNSPAADPKNVPTKGDPAIDREQIEGVKGASGAGAEEPTGSKSDIEKNHATRESARTGHVKATGELDQAKSEYKKALKGGDKEDIATKKTKMQDAKKNMAEADKSLKDAYGKDYEQYLTDAKNAAELKNKIKNAEGQKLADAQAKIDDFEEKNGKPKRDAIDEKGKSKYTNEDGTFNEEKYKEDVQNWESGLDRKQKGEYGKLEEARNNQEDIFNTAKNEADIAKQAVSDARTKYWKKTVWEKFKGGLHFIVDQLFMSILFSVVPEVTAAIAQEKQNEALYADIMEEKTFGGITMRIPAGLVPSENPAGGSFIYFDVQPGVEIDSNYLRSSNRRWFVSYDPTNTYTSPASYYIGEPNFPNSMLEVGTGLIFDSSGTSLLPAYGNCSQIPINFPYVVTLSTPADGSPVLWNPCQSANLDNLFSDLLAKVNGAAEASNTTSANIANLFDGSAGSHITVGGKNADCAYMFGNSSGETSVSFPLVLYYNLQASLFARPLDGFGVTTDSTPGAGSGVATGSTLFVQELQGLDNLVQIFGANYLSIFVNPVTPSANQADVESKNPTKGTADYKNSILTVLANAQPDPNLVSKDYTHIPIGKDATGKDMYTAPLHPNFNLTDPNLIKTIHSTLNTLGLSAQTVGDNVGFPTTEHLLARGLPLYQTDDTPTAQFLKNFVKSTSSALLASYVHDIVMTLDEDGNPVPAYLPVALQGADDSSGTISFVQNNAVEYIVSFISGLTYQKNNGYVPLNDSDSTIINLINRLKASLTNEIQQQITQIRDLFNCAVSQGPFLLDAKQGLYAFRIPLINMINGKYDGISDQQNNANSIDAAGKQQKYQQQKYTTGQEIGIDYDSFVYAIPNALSGKNNQGEIVKLPDYVVPVTIDPSNNNYVIIPLGSQAVTLSGKTLVQPSSQVAALISLVTSRIYSYNYKLLTSQGALYPGAIVGTEYMEWALNPGNFDKNGNQIPQSQSLVPSIPSLWFLNLSNFSYYSGLLPEVLPNQGTYDGSVPFINAAGKIQAFGAPLATILPAEFTGLDVTGNGAPQSSYPLNNITVGINFDPLVPSSSQDQAVINNINNGAIPSVYQVHTAWSLCELSDDGATKMALQPQCLCDNGQQSNNIYIQATSRDDILNGNFFYTINSNDPITNGLWVTARYSQSQKASYPINQVVGASITLNNNFSAVGAQFSPNAVNALINIGTGEVLVVSGVAGQYSLSPLTRYSVPYTSQGSTTPIAPVPLMPILLDPQEVLTAVEQTQGTKSYLLSLANSIAQAQKAGAIQPFNFASYALSIDYQSYNDGNYIYIAYGKDNLVKDCFTAYNGKNFPSFGMPFTSSTAQMVSLISGDVYNSAGKNVNNLIAGTGKTIAETPGYIENWVFSLSGITTLNNTLTANIQELSTSYQQQQANPVVDDPKSLQQKVNDLLDNNAAQLALSTNDLAALNAAMPITNTGGQLIFYDDEYYLRSIGSENGKYQYYRFNIAPNSVIDDPAKNSGSPILTVPTCVRYDEKGNYIKGSATIGNSAIIMCNAYGLEVDPNNNYVLTHYVPISHPSLPMTQNDLNLSSGASGVLMKLFPGTSPQGVFIPVDKTKKPYIPTGIPSEDGTTYRFYQNIYHTGSTLDDLNAKPYAYAPYDTLLQVTPSAHLQSTFGYTPYYASFITDVAYDLTGKQMYESVKIYGQQVTDSEGNVTTPINLPLIIWGDASPDNMLTTRALFASSSQAAVKATSDSLSQSFEYNTYQVDPYGISYEYYDLSTTPATIYTYTYIDPSYYLTVIHPNCHYLLNDDNSSIMLYDPSTNSTPPTTIDGKLYLVEKGNDGNYELIKTPLDCNGNPIANPFSVKSGSFDPASNNNNGKATVLSNLQALYTLNNYGVVYKVNSSNNTVMKNNDGTTAIYGVPYLKDATNKIAIIYLTNNLGWVFSDFTNKNFNTFISGNLLIAQNNPANNPTGVVYKINYNLPIGQQLIASFPASGLPYIAPSTGSSSTDLFATAAEIQNYAAQNLNDALNDAITKKLTPNRILMNMTNILSIEGTVSKILLAQNVQSLTYDLYQPGSSTNNGVSLATYSIMMPTYQANVLTFTGQRLSSAQNTAEDSLEANPKYVFDEFILIKQSGDTNVNPKYCIYQNNFYQRNDQQVSRYQNGSIYCSDTACNTQIDLSIQNLQNFGVNSSVSGAGNLNVLPSSDMCVSITSYDYYGPLVTDKTKQQPYGLVEHVYQYTYPLANPNGMQQLLKVLGISVVVSTSGILTPITSLDTTSLTKAGYTDSTVAIQAQIDQKYTDAITKANNVTSATGPLKIASNKVESDSAQAQVGPLSTKTAQTSCPDGWIAQKDRHDTYTCTPTLISPLQNVVNNGAVTTGNAATAKLMSVSNNAQENVTQLQNDQKAADCMIKTRVSSQLSMLNNLYYRIDKGADDSSNSIDIARLYYKIDQTSLSQLSVNCLAKVGDYVQYDEIDLTKGTSYTKEFGFIFNGTSPKTSSDATTGKTITTGLQLGEPTGDALSSADMIQLQKIIGINVLNPSTNQTIQNGIIPLTIGNYVINNLLYIADLLPGNNVATKYPSACN